MANVNKPIDTKKKEEDVNRKLQLYGILNAFRNGKVPSNEQVDVALNSFLESTPLSRPSEKLSGEGKLLVADARDVVQQAKLLLLSKNEGNLLQDFIWQTTQFDVKNVSVPNAPVDKDALQQHGSRVLEGLRTLGTLIITNGQFRKLLSDATILFRDMAGDAAANVAGHVRPSDESLAQIDRPADDNVWHDAPDISKDTLKKTIQQFYKGDASENAQDASAAQQPSSAHPTAAEADTARGNNATANALQQTVDNRADPETSEMAQSKIKEYRARVKEYLSKKMPQERREQTIWRLKKMVIECQQHPDYQQAIQTLLDLAGEYGAHANTLVKGGASTVQDSRSALVQAETDLKTLIERFANGTSTDDLWGAINTIYKDADQDDELSDWFKAMDKYIRRCLQDQGYILDDASTEEWNRLYDRGNHLLREKYRAHTDRIIDQIRFVAHQFEEDPQNQAFAAAVTKLFVDLGNDENGKATFKPHLMKDLTDVILPGIFENAAYIPIPRLEYSDAQIDAVIENLVLESDNFMPNVLEVFSENHMRWGRKGVASKHHHAVDVKATGVQMDLRDVSYYVKRKEGFPSLTDTGVADILLAGDGLSFRMKMSTAEEKDSANFFKIEKVDVEIKNLSVKLVRSKHKILFSIFKGVLLRMLRPALQKSVEKAIRDQVTKFDTMLYQIKLEADRTLEQVPGEPGKIPNVYRRYADATQKHILQSKKKIQEITSTRQFNYAVTKQDAIFPDIHLPGGISSKATEYKELALRGDKWESPIFSVGHASKSSDIPSAPHIVHKPATTAATTNGHAGANGNVGVNGSTKLDPAVTNPATITSA